MFDKLAKALRAVGPGFIIASVVLGPGSITVASRIGSLYGYNLLWVVAIAAFCMMTYTVMSARFGVSHKNSILSTIAAFYGRWFAVLIGFSAFLAAASFQFGNNLGVATAMHGLTGFSPTVWPLVFTPLAMILILWAKNIYRVLEQLMMILVFVMIVAFFTNLLFVKPSLTGILSGFVPRHLAANPVGEIAAVVGTTFSLTACLYQAYLVRDKGWDMADLKTGVRDTLMGITVLALITMLILITSAAALFPRGIFVTSAADMALQLEALFGAAAKYIFSIGLCAAAFSSLVVNAVIGGGLLSDGLGLGRAMHEKMPRIFSVVVLMVGMTVAVFIRGNVVHALVLAQASSLLAVPAIGIGLLLVLNNKKIMGEMVNNYRQNLIAAIGFGLILAMVFFMVRRVLDFFIRP